MIDSNAIQYNAAASAHIAILTAEFERINGPVQTTEILKNWVPQKFTVSCPDKPKNDPRPRVAKGPRKPRQGTLDKAANIERIPGLIALGMTTSQIAAELGWSIVHTQKVMAANGLKAAIRRTRAGDKPGSLDLVRALAASGATIAEMARQSGKNRKTIIIWLSEYKIDRGPKMDLSA